MIKIGKWKPTHIVALVTVASLFVLILFYLALNSQTGSLTGKATDVQLQTGTSNICANNLQIDGKVRVKDALSTSGEYLNDTTVAVKSLDTGIVETYTIGAGTTGDYETLNNAFQCQTDDGYEVRVLNTKDEFNSGEGVQTVSKEQVQNGLPMITIAATKFTKPTASVYDEENRADLYTDDTTDATELPATVYSDGSNSSIDRGQGECLETTVELSPSTLGNMVGQEGVVLVDYRDEDNTNDYNPDTINLAFDGNQLTTTSLVENDQNAVAGYEKAYALNNPIGVGENGATKNSNELTFEICANSDVDPDYNPTLRFLAMGDTMSSVDSDEILTGVAFTDATSPVQIASATDMTLEFDVS